MGAASSLGFPEMPPPKTALAKSSGHWTPQKRQTASERQGWGTRDHRRHLLCTWRPAVRRNPFAEVLIFIQTFGGKWGFRRFKNSMWMRGQPFLPNNVARFPPKHSSCILPSSKHPEKLGPSMFLWRIAPPKAGLFRVWEDQGFP